MLFRSLVRLPNGKVISITNLSDGSTVTTNAPIIFSGTLSVCQGFIADVSAPEKRAKTMGYFGAAFSLGFAFGPVLGGLFAGESMFHRARDASKVALVGLVDALTDRWGAELTGGGKVVWFELDR